MKRSRPLNILFVMPSFAPGGIEKHFLRQTRYFDKENYKIQLATLFYYPEKASLYKDLPSRVPYKIFKFKGYFDLNSLMSFIKFLKKTDPHIVVSSMFSANTLMRVLSLFMGFKVIAREHNVYSEKKWWQRKVDRLLSFVSCQIVTVSSDVAEFIKYQEMIDPKIITVISNGVDIEEIQAELKNSDPLKVKKELMINNSDKIILNIARLKEQKNHELLISSFGQFKRTHPEYKLLIVGEGNERFFLEKLIKELNLVDSVYLLGYRSDIFNFYAIADFFILSSRREGFPNVVLESLACGVPVISTPVAGVGEIIDAGYNGYIVRSTEEMINAMSNLASLNSTEGHQWAEASRNSAKKFDMSVNVSQYEKLFERCYRSKGNNK